MAEQRSPGYWFYVSDANDTLYRAEFVGTLRGTPLYVLNVEDDEHDSDGPTDG